MTEARWTVESPHTRGAADVARELRTDVAQGLLTDEVRRRLEAHGPNVLRAAVRVSAWRRFIGQFKDPLVILLLFAIGVAVVAWVVEGGHGWPVDAVVILLVVVLNAVLGFAQEAKAEDAVAALTRMTEVTSSVLRDGRLQRVPSAELVLGDVLVLSEGDAVGADARLLTAASLRVQEASLTGESEAVVKDPKTLEHAAALGDRRDMVFKGTVVVQGTGRAVITATAMQTEMGSIAELLEATEEEPTPLQLEIAAIGRTLGIAVAVIAVVVVGTILLLSDIQGLSDVITVLLLGVSLAVAAVPEGLPAILSVVLALGVQRMAARNAIVKKLSSVETLGAASVICSDKTGTLTRAEMMIERVATASGDTHLTGAGYVPQGEVQHRGHALKPGPLHDEQVVALCGGSLASNADLQQGEAGEWEIQGDPTEAAFLVAERKLALHERRARRFERVEEIPFSSERKMMSTVERDHEHGGALMLVSKGAPDVLIDRCSRVRIGAEVLPFDEARRAQAFADVQRLSDEALRTLAVAYRPLQAGEDPRGGEALEQGLIFVGTVGIIDPPRIEVGDAIREAHRAGIRVVMITGDHPRTAARIAVSLSIIQEGDAVLTGADLDKLTDESFAEAVRRTQVFARVAPVHKLSIVDALQADGQVVAMTGDGVNDAPALKSADIGVAMGITGTEVSKEAAKMILADDNFATIVAAVREGRNIYDNIRKFLRYLLWSNLGEVLTVFLGVIGAGVIGLTTGGDELVLPLLATQILWINLITDSAPALAMGVDPETEDVMARPPRGSTTHAINGRMWLGGALMGTVMAVATLSTMDLMLPGGLFDGEGDLTTARTAGFTTLVFAQLFNCFNVRSETASAFHHVLANHWLWAAIGLSLVLQVAVVHLGFLNVAFSTAPLSLAEWGLCALMGSSVLWASELFKLTLRARERR